jgi:curved DNA-binding protein CbpA
MRTLTTGRRVTWVQGMDRPGEFVFAWLKILDDLTYYELFGVAPKATADEVRNAFHVFCDTFHPDRHFARPADERHALSTIFKRGTEAYVVLSDVGLRSHYDAQLDTQPGERRTRLSLAHLSRPPSNRTSAPTSLDDSVRSPSARPFARRAEELLRKGDLRQAKLQLVMANHMDPGNEILASALRDVETKLASPK